MRTPEQTRRAKYNRAMRERGLPSLMDNTEARQHILMLHDEYDMTLERIASLAGVSMGAVHNNYRGRTKQIWRTTHERVMRVRPERSVAKCGAFIDPCGIQRRLGALAVQGYPVRWLAEHIGMSPKNMWNYAYPGKAKKAYAGSLRKVKAAYDELIHKDPIADYGVLKGSSRIAQYYARKNGSCPWFCWDDDTIDDPDAFPEWTGRCGTVPGWRIHYREKDLPLCKQCSLAYSIYHRCPHLAQLMGIAGDLK